MFHSFCERSHTNPHKYNPKTILLRTRFRMRPSLGIRTHDLSVFRERTLLDIGFMHPKAMVCFMTTHTHTRSMQRPLRVVYYCVGAEFVLALPDHFQ